MTGSAFEHIPPASCSVQQVSANTAVERVVAGTTDQSVTLGSALQDVASAAAYLAGWLRHMAA